MRVRDGQVYSRRGTRMSHVNRSTGVNWRVSLSLFRRQSARVRVEQRSGGRREWREVASAGQTTA